MERTFIPYTIGGWTCQGTGRFNGLALLSSWVRWGVVGGSYVLNDIGKHLLRILGGGRRS